MKDFLLLILGLSYIIFGILIFIRPKKGSKILEAIPWRQRGTFSSKLVPVEQKKARPFIVRLLGVACILLGLFLLSVSVPNIFNSGTLFLTEIRVR